MSIRANRFNDPALGAAFDSIASIFAPPSAGDMAGYATAKAKKEEAARAAAMFDYARDPNYSRDMAERMAFGTGLVNGTNGYYAQDQNNATTQRGQDISARTAIQNNELDNTTARYGVDRTYDATTRGQDVSARTAIQNNELDNTTARYGVDRTYDATTRGQDVTANTALATNAADNQRSFAETMFGTPLSQGQVMRPVPAGVAGMFGMDPIGAAAGAPKPMSETEVLGQERLALQNSGMLTPDMQLESILGEQTPVKTVGPDGRPVFSTPGAAARTGAPAYTDPGSMAAKDLLSYQTPDGRTGSAVFNPTDGTLTDEATGERLPAGTRTMKLQGEDADKMAGATTANITRGNAVIAEADYGSARAAEFRSMVQNNPGILGVPGMLRGIAQDAVTAASDLAQAGILSNPEGLEAVKQAAAQSVGASGERDPNIVKAKVMAVEMAYLQAKMQDPGGEVNVREFERLLNLYNGGIAGNAAVLESLDVLDKQLVARKQYGAQLRGGDQMQAPAAGGATRMRFDENGDPVQ